MYDVAIIGAGVTGRGHRKGVDQDIRLNDLCH